MENLITNESAASQQRPIKMRCPQCLKLYSVHASEIKESRPKFECMSCKTRFWVPFPECCEQKEIIAFPLTWLPTEPNNAPNKEAESFSECPKCGASYRKGDPDCSKCGVIFEKYQKSQLKTEFNLSAPSPLREQWEQVMRQYDNLEAHQRFIRECQIKEELGFASQQYKKMLSIDADDDIASQMLAKIVALTQAPVNFMTAKELKTKLAKRFSISGVMIAASLILMFLGYVFPLLRNIVGVGAAMFFFTLALRFYFRKV